MLIGIDGNEANVGKKVGISEFAFQLLTQFEKDRRGHSFEIYLKERPRPDMPPESFGWHYRIVGPRKLWTQFGLPLSLFTKKPKPNVFFTPTHYAPRFSPIPTIVSVMDVSYMFYPELFRRNDLYQLKNWTAYSVKNAKKVITISESTKSDIIKEYRVDGSKVAVIYPGIKQESRTRHKMSLLESKYNLNSDFVLFVGTLQPRKNIVRLIEAFKKVLPKYKRLKLVIVGKKGWLYEEILAAPEKLGIEDSVRFLDFVPDEDLPSFYENAKCYVLPSLYEGFGLPVLEAMKYGCPVVTSNVSSLPEAGGDAAIYFDPYDTDDIAKKISEVVGDKKLSESMIKKGHAQVKKFSWEKAAREVLTAIEEVGAGQ